MPEPGPWSLADYYPESGRRKRDGRGEGGFEPRCGVREARKQGN